MRLRQIEVFHAVYSTGSMTSAAAMLNVSQPSVSKVLAHAEQQLGYLLFERLKGKLVPTPEAHRLFAHVSAVYRDVDIAGTPAFGLEVLPQALASFRAKHGDTVFEIETLHLDQMHEALLESRIDLGVAFDPGRAPSIDEQTLATSRFVVLAPPTIDFGGKKALQASDLCGHPFIGLNSRGPLGQSLANYLEPVEPLLDVVTWSETYHVAKALVANDVGVTITDEITAKSGDAGSIRILPLDPELCFDIKVLSLAAVPMSIAAQNFVQHLEVVINDFLERQPSP
jgi:DNA-binding transcriptional LysR family regulator